MAHITKEQRYTISTMLEQGYSQTKISVCIGKNKSVVSREINRNCDKRSGLYKDVLAQSKYNKRMILKPKRVYLTKEIIANSVELLQKDYSPEQIVGALKKQGKATVSHEILYQYIWKDKKEKGVLHSHLRRQGRKYRKRGSLKDTRGAITGRVCIEKRPEIVDKRSRFGDLEFDLIIGEHHNQAILTINDRASGMLKMVKVFSKKADEITRKAIELLQEWKPYIHTITADNGKEFAGHRTVSEELNIDYYFAHPYHSWERGSNENLNGLIRQYFPKGSSFIDITDERIKEIETKLNERPRKRYNFATPIEKMEELLFNQESCI
ncbi:MAG: IS30 family transposase [Flavobacteriaceae bacterium]|nr:IS30 family transposase [Flavobacteriaceae bacterium]